MAELLAQDVLRDVLSLVDDPLPPKRSTTGRLCLFALVQQQQRNRERGALRSSSRSKRTAAINFAQAA